MPLIADMGTSIHKTTDRGGERGEKGGGGWFYSDVQVLTGFGCGGLYLYGLGVRVNLFDLYDKDGKRGSNRKRVERCVGACCWGGGGA